MKSAKLFMKCLESEGCKVIFGLPGEETLEIMEAIEDSSIRFFLTRHEATASFAAGAYGRMTMKPGVCLSTLGPGAVNLAIGVADALLDRSPVLAVTGQTESSKLGMQRHQLINLEEFFRPLTKWTAVLINGDAVPEKVRKAYRVAKTIPMGPVHLDFPVDVQSQETNKLPLSKETKWIVREPIDPKKLKEVAAKIESASFPVVVTGLSCVRRGHHVALQKFAEAYSLPVVTTPLSKGVLPAGHELSFGVISPLCSTVTLKLIDQSDLIITVGYDFIEVDTSFWLRRGTEVIHIDYIPADVDESYNASVEILGNIGVILDALTKLSKGRKKSELLGSYKQGLVQDLSQGSDSDAFPVKPQRLIRDLRSASEKNAIICVDTGAVKYLMTRYWRVYAKRTFFLTNGLASMGFAVPAAIAGKLVFPERQVFAVAGDGGFQMSLSDLKTIVANNLDINIVLFDNSGYGIVAARQEISGKRVFGTTFENPDFCKIAEAAGIRAYSVQGASEIIPAIQEALNDGKASLVHVPVERSEVEIMKALKK
jgi:acetolactate synthase-1/2/3 large subunit